MKRQWFGILKAPESAVMGQVLHRVLDCNIQDLPPMMFINPADSADWEMGGLAPLAILIHR